MFLSFLVVTICYYMLLYMKLIAFLVLGTSLPTRFNQIWGPEWRSNPQLVAWWLVVKIPAISRNPNVTLEDHRQGVEFLWLKKKSQGPALGRLRSLEAGQSIPIHLSPRYLHTHIYIYILELLDTILIILFLIGRRQFTSNLRLGVVPTSQRAALPRLFVQLLPDNSDRDHATMSWRILRQIQWWSIPKYQPFNDDIIPMVSWEGLTFNDGILGMVYHQIQRYHQLGLLLMINHPNLRSILVPNNDPRKGINSYWRYH